MVTRRWDSVWTAVHEERRALSADLATLDPEAWAEPSLCPGWDVHDVVAATLAEFDRILTTTNTPPAPPETRLVEAVVHGEDIRRPLGLRRAYPVAHVVPALRHQLATRVSMGGGRERAAGFRLVASDADIASGSGPEVRGPSSTLLLAVSGRPVEAGELTSPGVDDLIRRLREG